MAAMTDMTATGIALVIAAVGGLITVLTTSVVNLVTLWRLKAELKETNVKIDGMLVDRDKANVKEGERKEKIVGEATARTLAEGQKQGAETERASAAASSGSLAASSGDAPVPVVG